MAEALTSPGMVTPFPPWFLVQLQGPWLCISLPSPAAQPLGPGTVPFASLTSSLHGSPDMEQLFPAGKWHTVCHQMSLRSLCPLYTMLPLSAPIFRRKVPTSPVVKGSAYFSLTPSSNVLDQGIYLLLQLMKQPLRSTSWGTGLGVRTEFCSSVHLVAVDISINEMGSGQALSTLGCRVQH